jgi:hypothetical protein
MRCVAVRFCVVFFGALVQPPDAFACLCGRDSPAIEFAASAAVFTGTVVALTLIEAPDPAVRVELRVIERIKGTISDRVIVYMRAPAPVTKPVCSAVVDPVSGGIAGCPIGGITDICEFTDMFAVGRDYVVSAFLNQSKRWLSVAQPEATLVTHFCTYTAQLNSNDGRFHLRLLREAARGR